MNHLVHELMQLRFALALKPQPPSFYLCTKIGQDESSWVTNKDHQIYQVWLEDYLDALPIPTRALVNGHAPKSFKAYRQCYGANVYLDEFWEVPQMESVTRDQFHLRIPHQKITDLRIAILDAAINHFAQQKVSDE